MRKVLIFFICSIFALDANANSDDYPKSREDRIRDEIGSITGGEGVVFRPSKIRNKSTQTPDAKFNKYIWQSAIKTLDYAPIASLDKENGIFITEWFTSRDAQNTQLKVSVIIKDDVIGAESIDVIVQQKVKNRNRWVAVQNNQEISMKLSEEILRYAREIYHATTTAHVNK